MRKILITVALYMMILHGYQMKGHHEHVHYELPTWEHLDKTEICTSGATRPNLYLGKRR